MGIVNGDVVVSFEFFGGFFGIDDGWNIEFMVDDGSVVGFFIFVGDDSGGFFYCWNYVWVGYGSDEDVVFFDFVDFVGVEDDDDFIGIDVW